MGMAVMANMGFVASEFGISIDRYRRSRFVAEYRPQAGILLLVQAILLLQPTHMPAQKRQGTNIHAALNGVGLVCLIAGLIVIEVNKNINGFPHLESPHAILGVITYVAFILQVLIGIAQYYIPNLLGGVNNAKKIYKYHRVSGYVILVLALATVAAATETKFNKMALHIHMWAVIVTSLLVLAGILPRIKKQKIGL